MSESPIIALKLVSDATTLFKPASEVTIYPAGVIVQIAGASDIFYPWHRIAYLQTVSHRGVIADRMTS